MSDDKTSVVLFYNQENAGQVFNDLLHSLEIQNDSNVEIFAISSDGSEPPSGNVTTIKVPSSDETLGAQLNLAFSKTTGTNILLVDNRSNPIVLKKGAISLFKLACTRVKEPGLVYCDYELLEKGSVKEVHLLKHHIGRVRDNQDFGKVYFIPRKALQAINNANPEIKFNTLYDLRLRLSQNFEVVHVANRYAGSLYRVTAESKSQNVFDYLLASRESQVEAEEVLTSHLAKIKAKLNPGAHYMERPSKPAGASLKASVIIPVNNRPDFIGQAIESVQAQTVKEVEAIIVVNGGDDDPTVAAVKRYMPGGDKYDAQKPSVQLLVFDINNLGLCLNMGALAAKGEYYVQLDSDDRLKADAVEKILAVYNDDPKIGMVIGSYEVWEKQNDGSITRMENLPVVTHDEWTEENGRNNLLRINGAGAPRSIPIELIRQVGFSVNEEPYCRNYGEDYGMVLKLSEKHRIGRVWDAIYEVIRHSGGTDHSIDQATVDRNDEAKDFMRKEAILRRIELNKGN
ncbi:MAG: glycosyltransferase family 2 protein [Calditrichaeota bacterium]|nr:glycosyltransferase family 2 protein [Calditrichota bacterium]